MKQIQLLPLPKQDKRVERVNVGAAAARTDGSLPTDQGDFLSRGTFLHPHDKGGYRQVLAL